MRACLLEYEVSGYWGTNTRSSGVKNNVALQKLYTTNRIKSSIIPCLLKGGSYIEFQMIGYAFDTLVFGYPIIFLMGSN